MRNLFLAAAPLALLATPALADSSGQVDITGSVAGRCLFTTDSKLIELGELALTGTGTTAGKLDVAKVNGRNETLIGWCNNAAATMTVTATELTNSAPGGTGFDTRINYTASAVANAVTATDSSGSDGAGMTKTVGLFTGNVKVTLSAAATPGGGLLVAGSYGGNVVVTLAPVIAPPLL